MDESTHKIRIQQWMKTIQDWSTSGMSKQQWCAENGVSIRKFYYWQRIIRQELYEATESVTDMVPVNNEIAIPVPKFVEITPEVIPHEENDVSFNQAVATIKTKQVEIQIPINASGALLECIRGIVCNAL